jgi:hypothetical protein
MSKNSSYSRYSTSFKLAVNLGIADQADISALPSSTRHNFRNADFTDIVGKEYEDLTGNIHDDNRPFVPNLGHSPLSYLQYKFSVKFQLPC